MASGFATPTNLAGGSASAALGSVAGDASGPSPPVITLPTVQTVQLDGTPPAPPLLDIESDFDATAANLNVASDAITNANNFVNSLGDLVASLAPANIVPVFPEFLRAPAVTVPTAPTVEAITYDPPSLPAAFAGVVPGINSFPSFDAVAPMLLFPAAPQAPILNVPASPAVDLNFVYPTVEVNLPSVPQLLSIQVETFDGVTFPTLSATAPVLTAIAPSVVDYIPGLPYTDALLQELQTSLQQRLDIGNTGVNTGLPPIVEQNIWNASREREFKSQRDAILALERMEAMGYAFPPGTFIDAQIKIQTETSAVFAGSSRDIAIAQAKLEQDNIKMALDTATQLESRLIDYANQREQRTLEAAKYATEAGVAVYNAKVQAFEAQVNVYRAAIDVYVAQMNGARIMVEVYQAEIEAEKLKVDMNTALIEQYKVQVDAALASIQVFKAEVDIIQVEAQVEQLKVSVFGEQVRAYAAQAQLYATQVEGYRAAIDAEGTKETVYKTQADVYGTLVAAVSKEIDANIQLFNSQIAAKKLEIDAFTAAVQSEAEKVRAIAAQDSSVAAIYTAAVGGATSYNNALIEEYKTSALISEQVAQIGVSAAEANGKLYIAAAQVASDAAKVGAQVEAQIGASALGAITYATHRARQDSVGFSTSTSYSQSKSLSQSQSVTSGESTSVSFGTSTSYSTAVSAATSYAQNVNIAEAQ